MADVWEESPHSQFCFLGVFEMTGELVYLPVLLLIGLGILLFGDSGSSDDASDDEGTLGEGEQGTTDPDMMVDPAPVTTELDDAPNTFAGGPEDDIVFGFDGADTVSGGEGDDRLFLGADDDVSDGTAGSEAGDDFIRGGSGDDTLVDSLGANTIFGDLGADTISTVDAAGEATPDEVNGGFGNDLLMVDNGDVVTGGGGNDTFMLPILTGTEDPVIITDYTDSESLIVELPASLVDETASADLSESGLDTEIRVGDQVIAILQGYTNLAGLDAQFVVTPGTEDAGIVIAANDESQTLAGTANDDDITTGAGDDMVNSGAGDDTIDASGGGNNTINAGDGDDVVTGGAGDDVINGSLGADNLNGGGGSDRLAGGFGMDVLTANDEGGTNAPDTLFGGGAADVLIGDDGDIMTGGDGLDTFVIETIEAGDSVVTVTDFNVAEDQLQIGADGALTFVAANAGADTTVLVDGIAVFLLQSVTPAQMATATVTNAAA